MGIYDKKLGEEVDRKELGIMEELFTGKIRLLKITYTIQDEEGVTMDSSLIHKDYINEDSKVKSLEVKKNGKE